MDRTVSAWGEARVADQGAADTRPLLARPKELLCPAVSVRGVSFAYDGGPFILRDLDASVTPGGQLAIVGPSGCGKSTLLSLILGFLKPAEGAIDIAGTAPERFCATYAEYIGYVGAEPYVVTGTIRDNVLFGSRGAYSDEQIWAALAQAALTDVVRALPAGLDSPIRHHDVALSMGQRQRLALARALLPGPALLILDEASANLDEATEEAIADSIRALKGATTTIIVSHKLGLVRYADNIVDLGAVRAGRVRDSRSTS
jgi:ATP-binding cassette subfamily B protein/ATP-binding cassette subfamily C protein/ATP-binding cassette subfamily B multidrug efflux pump